jgi:DNA polymerase-3 subunit chi
MMDRADPLAAAASRIDFYHLQRSSLEQVLPKLLEKALAARHRVVVMAGSAARVEGLDALLWTWDPGSWLPHGSARDADAALQPICLTDRDENPNQADLLILTDGVDCDRIEAFVRCLVLFDGKDETALAVARAKWRNWAALGRQLVYYQQTEQGGWTEKARSNGRSGEGGA